MQTQTKTIDIDLRETILKVGAGEVFVEIEDDGKSISLWHEEFDEIVAFVNEVRANNKLTARSYIAETLNIQEDKIMKYYIEYNGGEHIFYEDGVRINYVRIEELMNELNKFSDLEKELKEAKRHIEYLKVEDFDAQEMADNIIKQYKELIGFYQDYKIDQIINTPDEEILALIGKPGHPSQDDIDKFREITKKAVAQSCGSLPKKKDK